jgi:3-oxoacyl-[acyl-carrier protein] reductase
MDMTEQAFSSHALRGSVALVTGAARGMGRATAELLVMTGAKVAVTDRQEADAVQTAFEISPDGASAKGWRMDVADGEAISRVVAEIADHFGRLDIVVNNAGIAGFSPLDSEDYDELWDKMIAINLSAHQRVVRAALPFLRRSPAARIINIASTEALGATVGDSAYAASKGGVVALTRAMALDLGKAGITANCICPGPIETPMTSFASDEDRTTYANRRRAVRRYGQPR